ESRRAAQDLLEGVAIARLRVLDQTFVRLAHRGAHIQERRRRAARRARICRFTVMRSLRNGPLGPIVSYTPLGPHFDAFVARWAKGGPLDLARDAEALP